MSVDRYPPAALFALVPTRLGRFEPVLRELDRPLEDDAIPQGIKADPARSDDPRSNMLEPLNE